MKNRSSYEGERSERLFAELCNSHFLEPFVFHSPKFLAPTESEAGDVVLWIRRQVVVFEVIARSVTDDYGSKSFVKRIGEKRKQLARDYQIFHDPQLRIEMQNETGTIIEFNKTDLDEIGFSGVILVDYDGALEPMHFESFRRTLDLPFPVAIMRS
jgi:hypothetical protein